MRASKNKLQKLKKYSKDEIIAALGHSFMSEHIVSDMLFELEKKAFNTAFDAHKKAISALDTAEKRLIDWHKKMCEKYGDGKTVKLSDVPSADISQGAELERVLKAAIEKEQKLDKQVNKFFKEGTSVK